MVFEKMMERRANKKKAAEGICQVCGEKMNWIGTHSYNENVGSVLMNISGLPSLLLNTTALIN